MCVRIAKNLSMCESCKQEHVEEEKHQPESCKEVGRALMRKRIQEIDGKQQTTELAKILRKTMKELEAGLLREIERLRLDSELPKEQCEMQKLEREERYAELYFFVKGRTVDATNSEATIQELRKRLLNTMDTASAGLKRVQSMIVAAATRVAPQHKSMFAAYGRDDVFLLKPDSYTATTDNVVSALKSDEFNTVKNTMKMKKTMMLSPAYQTCRAVSRPRWRLLPLQRMRTTSVCDERRHAGCTASTGAMCLKTRPRMSCPSRERLKDDTVTNLKALPEDDVIAPTIQQDDPPATAPLRTYAGTARQTRNTTERGTTEM
ncbi:MAG: hypothetical protein P4L87_24520 [Formivibrio sp.]|nr:hypothetical protein [Formivibrio sp.]